MKQIFLSFVVLCAASAASAAPTAVFGTPVRLAPTPSNGMGLAVEGTRLYTGAGDVIRCYETAADPLHPRLLGEITAPNGINVRQLAVRNGLVGITAREGQLMFFDFSDPAHPRFLSRYDCCELATGIDFAGNVCLCAQRVYGVEFIDVSDPAHPAHIAMRKTSESQSVLYRNGYCYSGEWGVGQVTVFDCRDMARIREVCRVDLHGQGDGLWSDGKYLYAATGHHSKHRPTEGLKTFVPPELLAFNGGKAVPGAGAGHGLDVFSLDDPAHPRHLGRVDFPPYYSRGNDFWTVRSGGTPGLVFSAQTYNGVFAVDVSDPAAPRVLDHLTLPCATRKGVASAPIGSIAVGDGVLYVAACEHGVVAVSAKGATRRAFDRGTPPAHPDFHERYSPAPQRFACWRPKERGQVRGVAVRGDRVWAACGDAGLHTIRIRGEELETVGRIPDVAQAYDVDAKGDLLVAAEGLRGWAFYRIGKDGALTETARIRKTLEGRDFGFWAWMLSDRWTVLSPRNGGYLLVDTSDPAHPVAKGTLPLNAPGWSKYMPDRLIDGRWFCYNQGNTAAAWVDVTAEPKKGRQMPFVMSSPDYRGNPTSGSCAFGDNALFMRHDGGYSLYPPERFTDATFPLKTTRQFSISGIPRTDGRHLLVCDRVNRRAAFFDMKESEHAVCEWAETLSGTPDSGVVTDGRAFIPCGYQGLLMSRREAWGFRGKTKR